MNSAQNSGYMVKNSWCFIMILWVFFSKSALKVSLECVSNFFDIIFEFTIKFWVYGKKLRNFYVCYLRNSQFITYIAIPSRRVLTIKWFTEILSNCCKLLQACYLSNFLGNVSLECNMTILCFRTCDTETVNSDFPSFSWLSV